jgi:hypothetical protein
MASVLNKMLGTFLRIQKAILFFFALFCIRWLSVAQTHESFFPHHVGDFWEYFVLDGVGNDTIQDRIIFDSSDVKGTVYLQVKRRSRKTGEPINVPWFTDYRIDTSGQVFAGGNGWNNRLHYKLNALQGEMWYTDGSGYAIVDTVFKDTIYDIATTLKIISYYESTWLYTEYLASGFGVVFRGGAELGYNLYLRGAYIDENLYGDTILMAIKELSNEIIPHKFQLFQNYPNPFNPITIINFELPHQSHVSLKVFDILGQEMQSLVDAVLSTGRYKYNFDAHELPSGIYFYRLETAEVIQTKKMILLR